MKILITGADGMLGTDLRESLAHHDVTPANRRTLDVTDAAAVRHAVAGQDVVINAAAFTNVDAAEENEDLAYHVNAEGARYLAEASKGSGARLVQISTDYVFDGTSTEPYSEDEELHPLSSYGRSKAAGERFVRDLYPEGSIVVRTAWLYGKAGPNFAATMLTLAGKRETVDVVTDQRGQPTWTRDLADHIRQLLEQNAAPGIYHGTNSGDTTWFEFARAVYDECGLDPDRIRPTDSARFVRAAPRPRNSVLAHGAWNAISLEPMRPWRDALHDAVQTGVFDDQRRHLQGDATDVS
ncbi:dTDP-4-dehydrorhamnose reductase [Paramicrobacterium chengjingii]|uniref:dTDP-4-dehydrorhamnose reductase n=1 Tax=Paramicrobacterium chengjingii TaxID=2769067 RepID=A0ABX6YFH7_9MICO|nr:dTDP-4-dehydrorhamnose reductase [Microbacterium chengjingii]QPZ37488.1 dTDP-4-dehydrorhamnose reductase [Microbacterium chengjingii]